MSRETARGRITVRRRAKDGNDGSPGKDGAYTAFIYKRSEDTPATPTGQVIPPTGWSLSPDIGVEEIEFDSLDPFFSGIWSRTGNILSIVEGDVDHGETLVERISFTTTAADTTITVLLTVNSEASYDWLLLGDIDSSVSRSLYNSRLSGANKTLTVDLYIAEAGDHFFEIAFSKDSSVTRQGEMASVEIVKVVGQAAGTIWFSQAFVDNGVVGTWSAPAPMQGARGEAGQKGAIVRTLVWKEGMEYRNDVTGDTIAPDGNRYIDVCTNKDIALLDDPSLVVMVCQKTHTASTSIPFASGTYWQSVNQMQPMITALILAQTINATFIDVESIAAKTAFVEALIANAAFIERLSVIEATIEKLKVGMVDTAPSSSNNKVLVDGDGITMLDADGYKKVRINNNGILDQYTDIIASNSGNYLTNGMAKSYSYSKYIYTSGVTVYLYTTEKAAIYNLAWCDKGSKIRIDSAKISLEFNSNVADAAFYCSYPGFALMLKKDGKVINTHYLGPAATLNAEDNSYTQTYTISWDYTCPADGYYTIEVAPSNSSGLCVKSPSGLTGATVINMITTLYFSFSRSNYQITHIGNNGIMQMTNSGLLLSSQTEFVVKRGIYMLRIKSTSGIQKSTDGGTTWTTL